MRLCDDMARYTINKILAISSLIDASLANAVLILSNRTYDTNTLECLIQPREPALQSWQPLPSPLASRPVVRVRILS